MIKQIKQLFGLCKFADECNFHSSDAYTCNKITDKFYCGKHRELKEYQINNKSKK